MHRSNRHPRLHGFPLLKLLNFLVDLVLVFLQEEVYYVDFLMSLFVGKNGWPLGLHLHLFFAAPGEPLLE